MEEARPQTDQQATNAALAALAAAGNAFALGQLWEINHGFLRRYFWQWYSKNKPIADEHGLTVDDLDQEGYFAIQATAKAYDPAKGSFLTLLTYYAQSQLNKALYGGHRRTIIADDGRQVCLSANPLNDCTSLDAPLDNEDEGSSTRGETIPDPAATQAFQQAEDGIYTDELHETLETAMAENLTAREADVLRRRYYDEQSLQAIGDDFGVCRSRIQAIEQKAFRQLKQNEQLARWADEILFGYAWHGTGFSAWANGGSVEERAVERLERMKAERQARQEQEEREQERRREEEWQAFLESSGYYNLHPERRPAGAVQLV